MPHLQTIWWKTLTYFFRPFISVRMVTQASKVHELLKSGCTACRLCFQSSHTWGKVHEVFAQTFPACCYKNPRDREWWSGGRGEILCVHRGGALNCCCNGRKNHPQKNESLLGVLRVAIALRKFPPIFARDEIPPPPGRLSPAGWYMTRGADFCIVVGQKRGRTDGVAIFEHTRLCTMWWGVHVQQHEQCHTQYKYYGTGRCHMQS